MSYEKLIISNPKIAKKGLFIGTIYIFVNKTNQKIYVGKTIDTYAQRFNEHKYNAFTKQTQTYFYNAIRKYGWDGFDKYIIYQTDESEAKRDIDKIVLEKETFYINLFRSDSSEFGYNLTSGGDGISGYKHTEETKRKLSESHSGEAHWKFGKTNVGGEAILQFDLDFNFIKEWPSMSEISRELGCKANNISKCCANQIDTYYGFIWVKKTEYYDGYLQEHKSRAKCKSNDKTVLQYDFLGNFIAKYISCSAAGKALGKKTVSTAASGRDPQLYGYIWIYEKDFTEELLSKKVEIVKSCKHYNKIVSKI